MKYLASLRFASRPQAKYECGYSLVELSMVLIVIALLISATTVGIDLARNASYQRLSSSFVRGWQLAYLSYKTKYNVVVNDSQVTPTGFVNQNTTGADGLDVCGTSLRSAMLAAGVEMPQGRAEGLETQYSYLDSNGNPQELQVCFRSINWMLETAVPGTYSNQVKNVMVIKQVTPDLARMIDALVDTARDAQFGKIRQYPGPADGATFVSPPKQEYSLDNGCIYGQVAPCGVRTGSVVLDETQIATMTIYYLMD